MKNLKTFAIFILTAALLSSCGGVNKMVKEADVVGYDVTPDVLELHGGNIDATITVKYPAKYFNKKAVVTLTPVLRYEGGEKALDPLVLQGQDATENNKAISFDNGGSAEHAISIPYEEAMMMSELYFTISGAIKDKVTDMGQVKLADGVLVTSLMVNKTAKVIEFGDKYEQIIPEAYEADIKYVINRADVRSAEMKKDEVTGIAPQVGETTTNDRLDLTGVEISAYASPDGELDLNTKLAEKRQKSAEKYLAGQMKKAKLDIDSLLSVTSTPEDWEGFKKAMEESDIQDKEMILRVLSMHSDPVVREQEIKNLTAAYETIAEDILPQLRRSKFTVNMEKIGWSDEELVEQWNSNPDTLVLEELLHTASLVDDKETKAAIYGKAAEVAPNCVRAHSNQGAVLFQLGKVDEAAAALAKAKALREHDNVVNNMGAVSLKQGEVDAAKEAFTASLGAGNDVKYNLATVNIIEGEYEGALNYFGGEASYNAALAKYLNGDTEGAMNMLAGLEKESPYRSYLMAIVAAKQDKPDAAVANLKSAVTNCKDPQMMKDHAKKNLEFAKLFETPEFKAVVE